MLQKIMYTLELSTNRVLKKPKLFIIILLSRTTAMIIPLLGMSMVNALLEQNSANRLKYSDTTYAYRIQSPLVNEEMTAAIKDIIPKTGVMVNLYNEYVIIHPDKETRTGRFIDINAVDADTFSIFYPTANSDAEKAFRMNESVCVIDYQTAKQSGLKKNDMISIHGKLFWIADVIKDQNSNVICIPYSKLSENVAYQHTFYLFCDTVLSEDIILNFMRTIFTQTQNDDVISLTESTQTKSESIKSTLIVVVLITMLYVICAIINISVIRYGDMRINQHDYAVLLAHGCSEFDLMIGILLENIILIPPALALDCLLFLLIRTIVPFPFYISITWVSLLGSIILSLICSCIVAIVSARKLVSCSCSVMLKEV